MSRPGPLRSLSRPAVPGTVLRITGNGRPETRVAIHDGPDGPRLVVTYAGGVNVSAHVAGEPIRVEEVPGKGWMIDHRTKEARP